MISLQIPLSNKQFRVISSKKLYENVQKEILTQNEIQFKKIHKNISKIDSIKNFQHLPNLCVLQKNKISKQDIKKKKSLNSNLKIITQKNALSKQHRNRNIIKFESKPDQLNQIIKQMQGSLQNINFYQSRKFSQQMQIFDQQCCHIKDNKIKTDNKIKGSQRSLKQDNLRKPKSQKKFFSLKSIRSIDNILSPQSTNKIHYQQQISSSQKYQQQLIKLKQRLQLKKIHNHKYKFLGRKQNNQIEDKYNTSIITQLVENENNQQLINETYKIQSKKYLASIQNTFRKTQIQKEKQSLKENSKKSQNSKPHMIKILIQSQKNNKKFKPTINLLDNFQKIDQQMHVKVGYNHPRWQQTNLDRFEQKLESLMLKSRKNSLSRINIIKMRNYHNDNNKENVKKEVNNKFCSQQNQNNRNQHDKNIK